MGKKQRKIERLTREKLALQMELFRSHKMSNLKGIAWESMSGILTAFRMLNEGENPTSLLRDWQTRLEEAGEANLADDFDDFANWANDLF